jgi:hypothetical protein
VLAAQCKNFAASQAEEKREAQPGSARSYKEYASVSLSLHLTDSSLRYLSVEREKLLESLSAEVERLRRRLETLLSLVEAVRANTRDFVDAVSGSRPFRLRVDGAAAAVAAAASAAAEAEEGPAPAADGNAGTVAGATACDPDVRFWLQLNGLLRYEGQLAGLRWPAVRSLTAEELRTLGVGGSEAARLRLVQLALKVRSFVAQCVVSFLNSLSRLTTRTGSACCCAASCASAAKEAR